MTVKMSNDRLLMTTMKRKQKEEFDDESIDSDDIPDGSDGASESESSDVFFQETPEEKRLRLAKQYIEQVKQDAKDDYEVEERLENQYLEDTSQRFSAIKISVPNSEPDEYFRIHRNNGTAIALGDNCIFSAAKDGEIIKVTMTQPRTKTTIGQTVAAKVLCLALYGNILASGDSSGVISLWDVENGGLLRELRGHEKAVTGLAWQRDLGQLFSCSEDMRIRVWHAETGNCLGTLFGHQMEAIDIDFCGFAVSCGGDRTIRLWKFEDEKQFVFHGGGITASIDCVSMFNNRYCVSGSQDGRICLWDLTKKKPLSVIKDAHGCGNWIQAITTLRFRKLFASGSSDGFVRIWRVTESNKIEELHRVKLEGHVNDLQFSADGSKLAVQISREQRLGRWLPVARDAKQGVYIIQLEEVH